MSTGHRNNKLSIFYYRVSLALKIKFNHKKNMQLATYLFDCVCMNGASPFFVMCVKVATHLITTTLQKIKGSCRLRPSGVSVGPGEPFLSTGRSRGQIYSSVQCKMFCMHILHCRSALHAQYQHKGCYHLMESVC
jgi:hypothetical protein